MANLPRHPLLGRNQNLTEIIKDYFRKGYTYLKMLEFLKVHYKKTISLPTRKRYLKKMNSKNFYKRSYIEVELI